MSSASTPPAMSAPWTRRIRREFRLVKATRSTPAKPRRSRERIPGSRPSSRRSASTSCAGTAPDKAVVKVAVEEKSMGRPSVGAGSTGSGFLGDVGHREPNSPRPRPGCTGQRDDRPAAAAGRSVLHRAGLLGKEIAAGGDLSSFRPTGRVKAHSTTTTIGGDLRAQPSADEHLRQGPALYAEADRRQQRAERRLHSIKESEGKEQLLGGSAHPDVRSKGQPHQPDEEYSRKHTLDVAGLGGSAKYVRNRVDAGHHYLVVDKWVVSLAVRVALFRAWART